MKCPNCQEEMIVSSMKIKASTTALGPMKCFSCKECKIQVAVPSPERPDDKVLNAWEKGWGSFG